MSLLPNVSLRLHPIPQSAQEMRKFSPFFDLEILCSKNAEEIVLNNPEILFPLVNYRLKDLLSEIVPLVPKRSQKKVDVTLKILYSMSLVNSRYGETVKQLEIHIPAYLRISQKANFRNLCMQSWRAIQEKPKDSLGDLQRQIKIRNRFMHEINELLNLFFYTDPEHNEKIKNVAKYARSYFGRPLHLTCKKNFPILCHNLAICENERNQLVHLRQRLHSQIQELQQRAIPLYTAQRVIILQPEREKLYDNYAIPFWNAGSQILKIAFRNGSENAKQDQITEQLVSAVWADFLRPTSTICDIDDFMRFLLAYLPEATYQHLETELRKGVKDEIFHTSIKFLSEQIRGPVTFQSLKDWLEKVR